MIKLENLSYSVPTGRSILEKVNFELGAGHFVGILGRNGSGKTTLIDLLLGGRPLSSGSLSIFGEDPFSDEKNFRNRISFLSQDIQIPGEISIGQFLKFQSFFYPNYSILKEQALLKNYGINPNEKVGNLSTGQQKKVQIIAGLSSQTELIIIDEITAVLDPETRLKFFKNLLELKAEGKTSIILATNIIEDLMGKVDSVLFLDGGSASVHSPEEMADLFNLKVAA